MRPFFIASILLASLEVNAAVVYTQPPDGSGKLLQSSWWDPDGTDFDQYVWDDFTLAGDQAITGIDWRGGYDPVKLGSGGPVLDFTISIQPSNPAGTQPDITAAPLARYSTGGSAGETAAGMFGGIALYDYQFTLPAPFAATAGVKYWVQIEAAQHGLPDWGLNSGTGGSGHYFRRISNVSDIVYQTMTGDASFTLRNAVPTYTIATSASPADGGSTSGGGVYSSGESVTVSATANYGFLFTQWTEGAMPVSSASSYQFAAEADRELVAVFVFSHANYQRPGDINQDGQLDISDPVQILGHLFLGSPNQLPCEGGTASSPGPGELALLDANGDGAIDLSDPIGILDYLFLGAVPPVLGKDCAPIAGCSEKCP